MGDRAGTEPRYLPPTTPKATHMSHLEGLIELRGPPTPFPLPASSLSSLYFPFLLFPAAWEEKEEKEGVDSRVTGAMLLGPFGYSFTSREPKT